MEAQGTPGDSRNQEGMLQPGKHIQSSAVPAQHNMQPGYHFQSVQKGQSGPKGRGWLWCCPEGEQLKRTRKWDHRIVN